MKKIAEILISILGIYLIVDSISINANRFFSLSYDSGFRNYIFIFGPSIILLIGGILCLIKRATLSDWILKGEDIDLPKNIDIDKIECVLLSIVGLFVFLSLFPYFVMSVNQFIVTPEYQPSDIGDIPVKSYAFVQVVALFFESIIAVCLLFFPQKIQTLLHKSRRL